MTTRLGGYLIPLARRLSHLRRFNRNKDGATAVEFGMVVAPFLALMFAIIETALVFFAGQTLETAVGDSARLILTGQAQTQSFDQAKFKEAVCGKIYALFDCQGGLHVDVRSYSTFAAADIKPPVDDQGKLIQDFQYKPGGPGEIVVVRIMYQWPVYLSFLHPDIKFDLSDPQSSGKRLLMATAAFRNEPFQ